jgi:hypothetical protein
VPSESWRAHRYSLVVVHAWTHSAADVQSAVQKLDAAGGFTVLNPEEFVRKMQAEVAQE